MSNPSAVPPHYHSFFFFFAMQRTSRFILRLTHFLSPQYPPKLLTFHHLHTQISSPKNQIVYNYLIHNFNLPESKALTISNRFSTVKTQKTPDSAVKYLKDVGFTDAQIINSANLCPHILFADIHETLKPKISILEQELHISGSSLCDFISRNPNILRYSSSCLSNRLKPIIDVVRTILLENNASNESANDNVFRVLNRCNSYLSSKDYAKKLLINVSYLKSCGVVSSQLANLLIRAPRLLSLSESKLKLLVSRVLNLGLSCDSRMFMHGLRTMGSISNEIYLNKCKLLSSFGFTEDECLEIFRKQPSLFSISEDKLRVGLKFFLETLAVERSVFIKYAHCVAYSMEDRVLPRYRVLKLLESKRILKNEKQFLAVLSLAEKTFLERYISRFPAHEEDLMFQYKGCLLESV